MEKNNKLKEEKVEVVVGGFTSEYLTKDYCKYDKELLKYENTFSKWFSLRCPKCNRSYHKMRDTGKLVENS